MMSWLWLQQLVRSGQTTKKKKCISFPIDWTMEVWTKQELSFSQVLSWPSLSPDSFTVLKKKKWAAATITTKKNMDRKRNEWNEWSKVSTSSHLDRLPTTAITTQRSWNSGMSKSGRGGLDSCKRGSSIQFDPFSIATHKHSNTETCTHNNTMRHTQTQREEKRKYSLDQSGNSSGPWEKSAHHTNKK